MSTYGKLQDECIKACEHVRLLSDAAKIASARSTEGEDVTKVREAWEAIDHLRVVIIATLGACAVELAKFPEPKAPRTRKR